MALKTLQSYSTFKVNVRKYFKSVQLCELWNTYINYIYVKSVIYCYILSCNSLELYTNCFRYGFRQCYTFACGSYDSFLFGLSDMSSFKSTPPQKLRVKAGHSVIFELPPVESVPTPSVTWQTEDNTLLYGTKYAVTSDNRQIILSVDSTDQKRYR